MDCPECGRKMLMERWTIDSTRSETEVTGVSRKTIRDYTCIECGNSLKWTKQSGLCDEGLFTFIEYQLDPEVIGEDERIDVVFPSDYEGKSEQPLVTKRKKKKETINTWPKKGSTAYCFSEIKRLASIYSAQEAEFNALRQAYLEREKKTG